MQYRFSLTVPKYHSTTVYCTVLDHNRQSSNAVYTIWTILFETVGLSFFCYATCCGHDTSMHFYTMLKQSFFLSFLLTHIILSVRFNGHFPGEPGLAGVYWSKRWCWWRWQLDYWSYKSCKSPVKSSPPTNQDPVFLQAGCSSCPQPTVSKHWRENLLLTHLFSRN